MWVCYCWKVCERLTKFELYDDDSGFEELQKLGLKNEDVKKSHALG
jgi:hypothetical protein